MNQDDAFSEVSTTGFTAATPPSIATVMDDRPAVPWPNNTYMILEKGSGRAITIASNGDGLCVGDVKEGANLKAYQWHCVVKGNYFAFYNILSHVFMGHNGRDGMRAAAETHQDRECIVARAYPSGGYHLLTPYHVGELRAVVVAGDETSIVTRPVATTVWEFVMV